MLAATSVTPQQLLLRYKHANERSFGTGIYHLRYRTTGSDRDNGITDFYWANARSELPDFRSVSLQNGVRVELGRIEGRSWEQSTDGIVLPESALLSIFDRVLLWALHHADARVRVLGITRSVPHEYVLAIAPNERLLQRRYFDVKTALLRKTVTQDYDRSVETVDYSDYINIGGRPIPSRESRSTNLSGTTYESTLIRSERLPFEVGLLKAPPSRVVFVPQARLPGTIDPIFGKAGILIRADINGDPYWLKLDSGSGGITLDRGVVKSLGLSEFARRSASRGGRLQYSFARLPRIDVGPVYARNLVVSVLDITDTEEGIPVSGLLGCDFLASRPLDIDFRNQTVTVENEPPRPADHDWTVVRTPLHRCTPSASARLGGQDATLLLDTGAFHTLINEGLAERVASTLLELGSTPIRFLGNDPLVGKQYVAPSLNLGGLDLGPLVVTVINGGRGQDLDYDGAVGYNVFRQYRMVLDYQHERTFFRKYPFASSAFTAP